MSTKQLVDHLDRQVMLPDSPKRIISLCPSITETLYYLGLDREIVGRTRYCIHPQETVNQALIVGGTKQVNYDRIAEIQPDLIIAEKEENTKEMVERLEKSYPVYVVDVQTYEDALKMIQDLGEITNRVDAAYQLVVDINEEFQALEPSTPLRVAYFIWKKPYMVVGKDTFIQAMLEKCGFENVFQNYQERYPAVSEQEIVAAEPEIIFLSSEPYPFKEGHVNEFKRLLPQANIILVDGEMFSWSGAHMLNAPKYFNKVMSTLKRK